MKLSDLSNGPEWLSWLVLVILVVMTAAFFMGKGSSLIAGYNAMSKEEQEQYDINKVLRRAGIFFLPIDLLLFVMIVWEEVLPAWTIYIFLGVFIADIIGLCIANQRER